MLYISFWIPLTNTINFEEEFKKNNGKSFTSQISDGLENKENTLFLEINENKNITVKYLAKYYNLKYCGSNEYGIITYKLKKNGLDSSLQDILEVQLYHAIKSFFHLPA